MRSLAVVLLLAATPGLTQTLTDRGPPLHRIVHKDTFTLRIPLGLLYDGRYAFRLRLYESPSAALRDNYLAVGVAPVLTPAFLRIGPYVEVSPLSFLNVWAAFQAVQYFGTFNQFQSFPGAQSNFSDTELEARGKLDPSDPLRNFPSSGWELTVGATFQVKLASILLRSQARLVYGSMQLHEGDTTYYDQLYDVLAPNQGFTFSNDLDVAWQGLDNRLTLGARYTFTAPLYTERHQLAGGGDVNNTTHRLGPIIGYNFKSEHGAAFNNPTIFVLAQWWLVHRYRTGVESSQAQPLIGIGFQMTGDFLPLK